AERRTREGRRTLVRRPLHPRRPRSREQPRLPGLRGPRTGRHGGHPRARELQRVVAVVHLRLYREGVGRPRRDLRGREGRRPLLGMGDVQGRPAWHTLGGPARPRDRDPDPTRKGRARAGDMVRDERPSARDAARRLSPDGEGRRRGGPL
ncbi:MAG: hypothetical protein AVDCRST_MAG01-01-4284, partial [uncultured Rubrobacteraceae bacterium]